MVATADGAVGPMHVDHRALLFCNDTAALAR